MKVLIDQGIATIVLTAEELGILRYTLNEGTEKLESNAAFGKTLANTKPKDKDTQQYAKTSKKTATQARAVNDALEEATQKWVRTPVKKMIKASEMVHNRIYVSKGEELIFSRVGGTGRYIVHPPGEPDMQSSYALAPDYLIEDSGIDYGSCAGECCD